MNASEDEEVTLGGKILKEFKVSELKEHCKARHLPHSGTKAAIIKRLKAALQLEKLQKAAQVQGVADQIQPNSNIGENSAENDFVKQYLENQRKMLQKQHHRFSSASESEEEQPKKVVKVGSVVDSSVAAANVPNLKVAANVQSLKPKADVPTLKVAADVPSFKSKADVPSSKVEADLPSSEPKAEVPCAKVAANVPTLKAETDVQSSEVATHVPSSKVEADLPSSKEDKPEPAAVQETTISLDSSERNSSGVGMPQETKSIPATEENIERSAEGLGDHIDMNRGNLEAAQESEQQGPAGDKLEGGGKLGNTKVVSQGGNVDGVNEGLGAEPHDGNKLDPEFAKPEAVAVERSDINVAEQESQVQDGRPSDLDGNNMEDSNELNNECDIDKGVVDETHGSDLGESINKSSQEQDKVDDVVATVAGAETNKEIEAESLMDEVVELDYDDLDISNNKEAKEETEENEEQNANEPGTNTNVQPTVCEGDTSRQSNKESEKETVTTDLKQTEDKDNRPRRRISLKKNSLKRTLQHDAPRERKRKWGKAVSVEPSHVSISTDSLKDIIDVKAEAWDSLLEDKEEEEKEQDEEEEVGEEGEIVEELVMEVDEPVEEQQDERKVVTTFRPSNTTEAKISPPQEVTEEVNPPHTAVEPPKQASSCVLHISNLVRPFAISQLKQLLSEHGPFDESSFWINNIKSHCFATYESKEVAEATRRCLHRLQWPVSSPKKLQVEYSDVKELDYHKQEQPVKASRPAKKKKLSEKEVERNGRKLSVGEKDGPRERSNGRRPEEARDEPRPVHEVSRREHEVTRREHEVTRRDEGTRREHEGSRREHEGTRREHDVEDGRRRKLREWDRNKLDQDTEVKRRRRDGTSPHDRETRDREPRDRERREQRETLETRERREPREQSGDYRRQRNDEVKAAPEPPKLLDDLFRKTKAMPCVYWFPLTDNLIAERENERESRRKEREKLREEGKLREDGKQVEEGKPREGRQREECKPREGRQREEGKPREGRQREEGKPREGRQREEGKPREGRQREEGKPRGERQREEGRSEERAAGRRQDDKSRKNGPRDTHSSRGNPEPNNDKTRSAQTGSRMQGGAKKRHDSTSSSSSGSSSSSSDSSSDSD